jgi:hypothetical protein
MWEPFVAWARGALYLGCLFAVSDIFDSWGPLPVLALDLGSLENWLGIWQKECLLTGAMSRHLFGVLY